MMRKVSAAFIMSVGVALLPASNHALAEFDAACVAGWCVREMIPAKSTSDLMAASTLGPTAG